MLPSVKSYADALRVGLGDAAHLSPAPLVTTSQTPTSAVFEAARSVSTTSTDVDFPRLPLLLPADNPPANTPTLPLAANVSLPSIPDRNRKPPNETLPSELVGEIAGLLDKKALLRLRQTNHFLAKHTNHAFMGLYFGCMRIHLTIDDVEKTLNVLERFENSGKKVKYICFHDYSSRQSDPSSQFYELVEKLLGQVPNVTSIQISFGDHDPDKRPPTARSTELLQALIAAPLMDLMRFSLHGGNWDIESTLKPFLKVHGSQLNRLDLDRLWSPKSWADLLRLVKNDFKLGYIGLHHIASAERAARFFIPVDTRIVRCVRNPESEIKRVEYYSFINRFVIMVGVAGVKAGIQQLLEMNVWG